MHSKDVRNDGKLKLLFVSPSEKDLLFAGKLIGPYHHVKGAETPESAMKLIQSADSSQYDWVIINLDNCLQALTLPYMSQAAYRFALEVQRWNINAATVHYLNVRAPLFGQQPFVRVFGRMSGKGVRKVDIKPGDIAYLVYDCVARELLARQTYKEHMEAIERNKKGIVYEEVMGINWPMVLKKIGIFKPDQKGFWSPVLEDRMKIKFDISSSN